MSEKVCIGIVKHGSIETFKEAFKLECNWIEKFSVYENGEVRVIYKTTERLNCLQSFISGWNKYKE